MNELRPLGSAAGQGLRSVRFRGLALPLHQDLRLRVVGGIKIATHQAGEIGPDDGRCHRQAAFQGFDDNGIAAPGASGDTPCFPG
jgi:hypothetical protein